MLLLVSGATTSIEKYKHKNLGQLLTPQTGNNVDRMLKNGLYWACDNGAFAGFDEVAYMRMVKQVVGKPRLLFVTVPDVVADAEGTWELFKLWQPVLKKYYDVPLAYVLQDGVNKIPWDDIRAVFIGGTTEWKIGKEAYAIVQEAKERGKWVHMGRVNSYRRIQYARSIGCDSVDGSGFSMFPDAKIPDMLKFLESEQISIEGVYE